MSKFTVVAFVLMIGVVLSSCREAEQGRPLQFDKGNYSGPADTTLNDAQLRALNQRIRNQAAGGI